MNEADKLHGHSAMPRIAPMADDESAIVLDDSNAMPVNVFANHEQSEKILSLVRIAQGIEHYYAVQSPPVLDVKFTFADDDLKWEFGHEEGDTHLVIRLTTPIGDVLQYRVGRDWRIGAHLADLESIRA